MNEFELGGGAGGIGGGRINTKGRGDPNKKIFIGGVPRTVADDEYREYFGSFGELDDCILMRDSEGICRGFGFVTYREQSSYDKVMEAQLQLRGRPLEQKKAVPRKDGEGPGGTGQVKVFIGGLPPEVNKALLDEHFGNFGEIIDSVVMMDPQTRNSRGFGFVTFRDPSSVDELMKTPRFELCGKMVQCKRAQPQTAMGRGRGGGGGRFSGGRFGGDMGRVADDRGYVTDSRYGGGGIARYAGDRYGGPSDRYAPPRRDYGGYSDVRDGGYGGGGYGRDPYRPRPPVRDPWLERVAEKLPRPMGPPPPRRNDDIYAYNSSGGPRYRPYN